ncbi:MAG: hypothetical protein FWD77_04115 [Betaproteobacteria bacterium]|nr:hypothetical protein [Betaproteobacteria bacterium]
MKKMAAALIGLVLMSGAQAGVYADDLGKCLVSSTSSKDKTALIRWIFAITALHPDVASISRVTDAARDEANRNAAALVERLITQSCKKQANEAIRYEGAVALEHGFQVLGQVAMKELMSNKKVSDGFEGYTKYLDKSKFENLGK